MCRMAADMEHSQTAAPVCNKCYVEVCVNDVEYHQCYSPWVTQTSMVRHTTHIWLHKNSNLHILLVLQAAALPTISVLLNMMRVWLAVRGAVGHTITPYQFLIIFIYLATSRWRLWFHIITQGPPVCIRVMFRLNVCLNKCDGEYRTGWWGYSAPCRSVVVLQYTVLDAPKTEREIIS